MIGKTSHEQLPTWKTAPHVSRVDLPNKRELANGVRRERIGEGWPTFGSICISSRDRVTVVEANRKAASFSSKV